jgi:thioesterase domain-containing protein
MRVLSWARKNLTRVLNSLKSRLGTGADQPVDLPVDGPASDRLVERFAAQSKRLHSRLLIVRANEDEVVPPWVKVRSDLGWAGRADHVIEHQIAAHHLQILREPHVRSLTIVLARETRR